MYTAIVTRITVKPHPNADKLALGTTSIGGFQVIVGKDTEDGTLGVFFPADGQLSEAFCVVNNLYKPAGMFEQNRRVKVIRLRGEQSEGYWCPLSLLELYTGADRGSLFSPPDEGIEITEVRGLPLCNKYETPATVRARENREKQPKKNNRQRDLVARALPQHFDTTQFRYMSGQMAAQTGAVYIITEKLHGTSGRVGRVQVEQDLRWYHKVANWTGDWFPKYKTQIVHGTRRVILGSTKDQKEGYYGSHGFRSESTRQLVAALPENTCVYFEIVGWVGEQTPIMPPYGNPPVHYSYGLEPGECKLFVYRITGNVPGFPVKEWSWSAVEEWCRVNNIPCVPVLIKGNINEHFITIVEAHTEGTSVLDNRHIREGVVVRVEVDNATDRIMWAKNKSFTFREAEGMIKADETYIDLEEAEG